VRWLDEDGTLQEEYVRIENVRDDEAEPELYEYVDAMHQSGEDFTLRGFDCNTDYRIVDAAQIVGTTRNVAWYFWDV
jgi:hypothetical protein